MTAAAPLQAVSIFTTVTVNGKTIRAVRFWSTAEVRDAYRAQWGTRP